MELHSVQHNLFPNFYYWLTFCDPYQSLQLNCRPTDRGHFFVPISSLYLYLDALECLRKTTINFVRCGCPTARLSAWKDSAPNGRIFVKFCICRKVQVWLNSENKASNLNGNLFTLVITSRWILKMRNISENDCRENRNIYFLFTKSSPKFVPFKRSRTKIQWSKTGHRLQYNTTQKRCDSHPGQIRLQTQIKIM